MSSFGDLNRVNTNIQSMDSQLSLNRINRGLAENQLRMSTGLRINRAEDDAAGYSIATKLSSRVSGLNQALQNVGDAKSILDIAESSFDTIMDNLIEMKGLVTQGANETLGDTERGYIGEQISALGQDINDIANQSVFQDFDLLNGKDGEFSLTLDLTFQVGEREDDTLTTEIGAVNVNQLFTGDAVVSSGGTATGAVSGVIDLQDSLTEELGVYSFDIDQAGDGFEDGDKVTIGGQTYTYASSPNFGSGEFGGETDAEVADQLAAAILSNATTANNFTASASGGTIILTEKEATGGLATSDVTVDTTAVSIASFSEDNASVEEQAGEVGFAIDTAFEDGDSIEIDGQTFTFGSGEDFDGDDAAEQAASLASAIAAVMDYETAANGSFLTLTEEEPSGTNLATTDVTVKGESSGGGQGQLDFTQAGAGTGGVWTADDFRTFIGEIDSAIDSMSRRVNDIGIAQSSLSVREVTLSKGISANQSAISRIMDTDFAKEQSESIRLQILQQTATSALAQANLGPQSVLGFLG